jgi:hypothetical protein
LRGSALQVCCTTSKPCSRYSLQGKHPQHRGTSDPAVLGRVERYFLEIRPIPRLRQRIACCIFSRSFAAAAERVG